MDGISACVYSSDDHSWNEADLPSSLALLGPGIQRANPCGRAYAHLQTCMYSTGYLASISCGFDKKGAFNILFESSLLNI
jgi:hypothetical protein